MNNKSPLKLKHIIDNTYIDTDGNLYYIDVDVPVGHLYVSKYDNNIKAYFKEIEIPNVPTVYLESSLSIKQLPQEDITDYLHLIL